MILLIWQAQETNITDFVFRFKIHFRRQNIRFRRHRFQGISCIRYFRFYVLRFSFWNKDTYLIFNKWFSSTEKNKADLDDHLNVADEIDAEGVDDVDDEDEADED